MDLIRRLIDSGCIVNPPPDVVAALAPYISPPVPAPSTQALQSLLREPLRDSEFASAARHLIPPLLTYVTAAAPLIHTVHLWRSGLAPDSQLAASYDAFRTEVTP